MSKCVICGTTFGSLDSSIGHDGGRAHVTCCVESIRADRARLEQEVERLREALTRIGSPDQRISDHLDWIWSAQDIAQKALQGSTDNG